MLITLTLLLFVPMSLYWIYWRFTNKRLLELASQIPGPRAWPLVGNTLLFIIHQSDQMRMIASLFDTFGEYIKFWIGPDLNIAVKNPADVKLILTSNKVNEKGPLYKFTVPFIGPGILSGGPTWRLHRKIATPSYNKKAVSMFMQVFNEESEELIRVLSKKGPETYDIYYDVVQRTTSTVCQTLMGVPKEEIDDLECLQEVIEITPKVYDLIFKRMTQWWLQVPIIYWWSGNLKKHKNYAETLNKFIEDLVGKRRKALEKHEGPEESMGIVDRYILSGELTDQEVKWESFSLFTTSQEAGAKIASGVFMILGLLPEWQERVYNEVMEVIGPEEHVTTQHLKQLHCMDMVYKETLRYFSIAGFIQRTVEEEITIKDGKITLPVGTSLLIPIHDIHRDPKNWEEPLKVNVDRFLPENVQKRDPNAFIPFSLGPMDCLGRVYATAMIKTMVVHVIRKFYFEAEGPVNDIDLEIAISVRAKNGYRVRTRPRSTYGNHKMNGLNNNH